MILDEGTADAALPQLRALASVTHVASPRVVVVSTEQDPASEFPCVPGVRRVYADDVPTEELEADEPFTALSREEALVARAWLLRQRQPEKHRPGEGLAWDTEGFDPP